MNNNILQWIESYQKGRGGIYPHMVAVEVSIRFGIDITLAREFVLQHIKNVLAEKFE